MPHFPKARDTLFLALARHDKVGQYLNHRYDYQHAPAQLCFLAEQVARTLEVPGSLIEIGCAHGATTVFLNRHLADLGSTKSYYALDTFGGFAPDDIEIEHRRGRHDPFDQFRRNSRAAFEQTMRLNRVPWVTAVEADAKTFDYRAVAPISFCLVDVDLYQPVLAALESVYPLVSPGGILLVDDCDPEHETWRGSYEAYAEFTAANGLAKDIRHRKFGVIGR